ncbi:MULTISPECIES: hypothetical protein [Bacillota]|uniref:hypothetical protein n=1 Tax=Bacillota TaxID=1239 RepID=UPI0039EFCB02
MLNDKIMDLFQALFGKIWEWLLGPFKDLRGFKELIYGKDGDTNLAYGIFTSDEISKIYTPGLNAFVALAVTAILVGIVIAGMRISSSGINPSNRTYVIEFFKDLLIVGILLFNLSTLYHVIFGLNYTIVNLFAGVDKELIDMKDSLDTSKGVLGELIIQLSLLGLAIWANFYYMMRRLTLLLLMIMGPLMLALYLIPQTKGITMGWLKELTGTVFVQAVHAALYWMVALMSATTSGIEGVILYIIFIPVAESIRALLGLGGQMNDRLTKSAAMFGGAALAGMYGSVRGALGGKSVTEALRNVAGKATKAVSGKGGSGEEEDGAKGLLSNAGTDIGSTSRAERMLKAGEILSKSGKAVFGAAGAIAGSPMGPMGAIAGSTIGFNAGGVVGGVAGRAGMAIAEGGGKRIAAGVKAGVDKFKGIKNAESAADEKLAKSIAEDDTTKWASENQESFMKDLKERFPDAHQSSLNKMWDNEVSAKHGEYLEKARATVGQIKKTNGQHAKASDLVNSTVDNLTNDWAKNNKDQFIKDYDTKNPLPANPTEGDILKHNQNREAAWQTAVAGKRAAISTAAAATAVKLGQSGAALVNNLTNDWAKTNKDQFMKDYDSKNPLPSNATQEDIQKHNQNKEAAWQATVADKKQAISNITSLSPSSLSKGVSSVVSNLTNEWANKNKDQFMKDYDANHPLPANATKGEVTKHNQNKEAAWQNAVSSKKDSIGNTVSSVLPKINNAESMNLSYINKEDFANTVGQEVSSVVGTGGREAVTAVKAATANVKNASLYSGKSVNTPYLANQLASIKTAAGKAQFIKNGLNSGEFASEHEATQQWNQVEAPKRYAQNMSQVSQSMPRHIPLDHAVIGNKVLRAGGAVAGSVSSFVTGTAGVKEVGQFLSDTKIGQGAIGAAMGLKQGANFDLSQGVITGTVSGVGSALKTAGTTAVSNFKNHVPSNVVEKQAGFKNSAAYASGIVGGVGGYKAGANFGAKYNPYNNAANQQIAEIAEIAHMAQTITGPNGESIVANGAVRMVTTANQTVLQVKDKAGQVQTVSRIASGDSSLQKGQTVYQDLTIQDGQLITASNAYKEDSGGGRVALNRNINVNPNKLVANRNTPQSPRVVQEVQSYNQKVDSGQYYLKDAMNEMTNIHMVVDRNRSYLVGNKGGKEYRISQYGPGDARLNTDEIVYRKTEVRNKSLVVTTAHRNEIGGEEIEYHNSARPEDLAPKIPPNKRSIARKQNEKFRNKSFTEPLR